MSLNSADILIILKVGWKCDLLPVTSIKIIDIPGTTVPVNSLVNRDNG